MIVKKIISAINAAGIVLAPWTVAAPITAGVLSATPVQTIAQQQPTYSAEQTAALQEAEKLNEQVIKLHEQGQYNTATPLLEKSLTIREKVLGKEHPDVAQTLNNLGELYREQGKYQQAEPLYQRSLAILEKVLGKEHPDVAHTLNNLATLYHSQGKYEQAEPLYQRSLAILEKGRGKENAVVAHTLNNLAELYREQGNYQQAEPLYQRSLAIMEKVIGKEHPSVAYSLIGLANLYAQQGKYEQAEPLYQRSLAIMEKALGKEHPLVATCLLNLATLYQEQGKYQQAEPLYQRSLAIMEKVISKEHPSVAYSLNGLGNLYAQQGKYEQAEPFYQRSLAIMEKVTGKEHPFVAKSFYNLANLYHSKGDITRSVSFLRRGLEVETHNLNLIFAVGSEQRKQNYIRTFKRTTDWNLSLSLSEPTHPQIASIALTTILRRKGLVLDAVSDSIQTLRAQLANKPETQKLFNRWLDIQQQLSNLVFSDKEKNASDKTRFEQLETEREKLEATISSQSAEFRNQTQPVELSAIQSKIPQNAALVEIVQYQPFNDKAKTEAQRWGKPRYAAAVLRAAGEPKWLDLGEAEPINKLAEEFRVALALGKPFDKISRSLNQQLIKPIRPLLGNASHILISPDSNLSLIPFEAIKDEQGKFLIQSYAFSYITTGRDLLRFQPQRQKLTSPVVFADINYDQQQRNLTTVAKTNGLRGSQNRSHVDLANFTFEPLSATKEEATAIKGILPNTQLLLGENATETAVKQLQSPRILHLATHGFFFVGSKEQPNSEQNSNFFKVENPLLRSGLALAGFNKRNQGSANSDDGVLTALEVAGLDLRGTELVVLSACDTGRGDVKVGDGLYGLRRALVIAGSQTQVLSLWLVDDVATKELMVKYYQNLQAGKGRHEALRQAQLEFLKHENYQHPKFWAAFVPSGNWTPLNEVDK